MGNRQFFWEEAGTFSVLVLACVCFVVDACVVTAKQVMLVCMAISFVGAFMIFYFLF